MARGKLVRWQKNHGEIKKPPEGGFLWSRRDYLTAFGVSVIP
jgi:hypothetical protein